MGRGLVYVTVILLGACTSIRQDEAVEKPVFLGGISTYSPLLRSFEGPEPVHVWIAVSFDPIPFSSIKPCKQTLHNEAGRDRLEMGESYGDYARAYFEKSGIETNEKAQVKFEFSIEYADVPVTRAGSATRYCLLRLEAALVAEGEHRVFWQSQARFTDNIRLYEGVYKYMVKPENLHSTVLAIIDEHVKYLVPALKGGSPPPLDVRPWMVP